MASTLHPPGCIPKDGPSSTTVVAMRTNALHAASRHYVQPLPNRQQTRTAFGAQSLLPWSGRQARSCSACCTLQTDAPGCSEDPVPPVRYTGVHQMKGKETYMARIYNQGKTHYLGLYPTPGAAACMYDEACIFMKRDPVNFPMSQYNEAAILQYSDFETFVRAKRAPRGTCSRFRGVTRSRGKWKSTCLILGQAHFLGYYSTEELAARAHDKVRIYQGLGATNFPETSYDVESICLPKSVGSLVASLRAEAKALTKAQMASRFVGLNRSNGKWSSRFVVMGQKHTLGRHATEELAAQAYDRVLIYQGLAPINFPDHPYNVQEICRPANLTEFIHQSLESSARMTKSQQSSRYNGVSWDARVGMWQAYVYQGGRKVHLGCFVSEKKAAILVDEERQRLGKDTANFPLKSRTTAAGKTWPDLLGKQAKTNLQGSRHRQLTLEIQEDCSQQNLARCTQQAGHRS